MELTEKQKNCKCCHPDLYSGYSCESTIENGISMGITIEEDGKVSVDVWFSMEEDVDLELEDRFNFCPMCGRPLNEEEE